jgi:hypothetical protein
VVEWLTMCVRPGVEFPVCVCVCVCVCVELGRKVY